MSMTPSWKKSVHKLQWLWFAIFLALALAFGCFQSSQYTQRFEEVLQQQSNILDSWVSSLVYQDNVRNMARRRMVYDYAIEPHTSIQKIYQIFDFYALEKPLLSRDLMGIWLSEIFWDDHLEQDVVLLLHMNHEKFVLEWFDIHTFQSMVNPFIQESYPLILIDSNLYGIFLGGKTAQEPFDFFSLQRFTVLNNPFFIIHGSLFYYREYQWNQFRVFQLGLLSPDILQSFLNVLIPFIIGLVFFIHISSYASQESRKVATSIDNLERAIRNEKSLIFPEGTSLLEGWEPIFQEWNNHVKRKGTVQKEIERLTKRVSELGNREMEYNRGINAMYQVLARLSLEHQYDVRTVFSSMMETVFLKSPVFKSIVMEKDQQIVERWGVSSENYSDMISVRYHYEEYTLKILPSNEINENEYQVHREMLRLGAQTIVTLCLLASKGQIDPRSGLLRFDVFRDLLEKEMDKCHRYQSPGILSILELNELPQLLEQFGIGFMEGLEQKIGTILQQGVRSSDLLCKYSEKSYLLFFLQSNDASVEERLQSIAKRIIEESITLGQGKLVQTFRFALSSYTLNMEKADDFIQKTIDNLAQKPSSNGST